MPGAHEGLARAARRALQGGTGCARRAAARALRAGRAAGVAAAAGPAALASRDLCGGAACTVTQPPRPTPNRSPNTNAELSPYSQA
eukprot:scaffold8531_cov62-Phaeocystis_antarctica.AAC.7